MPRIEDRIAHCAFYLFPDLASAKKGDAAGGTGFVVARAHDNPSLGGCGRLFLVSNKHVVHQFGCSVARINRKDGGVDFIELEPHEWIAHPQHDIAAVGTDAINPSIHECTWVNFQQILNENSCRERNVGIGDDVFMVGRFIGHDGGTRNRPSVRFGNISIAPANIINSATGASEESFGVEMRSKPGYSGSPVFVYDFLAVQSGPSARKIGFQVLLGVEWGHINERAPLLNEYGLNTEKKYTASPTGMNGVVPGWRLRELLDMPELREPFDAAERALIAALVKSPAIIEPSLDEAFAPPATGENPFT